MKTLRRNSGAFEHGRGPQSELKRYPVAPTLKLALDPKLLALKPQTL